MKITKNYRMKAGSIEENCLKGSGNVMGQIDRGGDLVFPGFFKNAIPGFLKSGFMPVGHDWSGLPIAMPVKAAEQGNVLYCEFEFHSTDRAQEARVIAQERMEKGLDVGLSVGFDTSEKGVVYFPSGAKALEHAKSLGCDMSLFDTKQVLAHPGMCRGLLPDGCSELFEISYVSVPMSQGSNATMVKSLASHKPLEDLRPSLAFIEKYGPVENWTQKEWWEWLNGSQDDLAQLTEAENGKGEALGEYAEASATIAAVSDLTQSLMGRLYSVLYGWEYDEAEEPVPADQIAAVTPMLNEWRDTALRIISALIQSEDASETEGAKSLLFSLTRRSKIETPRDFERLLRDAGFSRRDAKALINHGYNSLRDAGELQPTPEPPKAPPVIDAATAASRERAFRLLAHRSEGLRLANLS